MSQRILGVLSQHAPQIEVYSIDEAFMDLSALARQDFTKWGNELKSEIQRNIGMPVSVGVAPTKTLAKLASAYAKKHQQTCVLDPKNSEQTYLEVLSEIPVGYVWGIGWRSAPKFLKAGIRTALQLSQVSEAWIHSQLGVNGTRLLAELKGEVAYPFEEDKQPQKTLMASRSFGHTVKNAHDLEAAIATFASQAAYRLRSYDQVAGSFGIYLRYKTKDGQVEGRTLAMRLPTPTNDTSQLVQVCLELMNELYDPENGYKKAGVFANNLFDVHQVQMNLFEKNSQEESSRRNSFMEAVDSINQRFGANTIHIGTIDPRSTKWHALKKRMSPAYTTDWKQLPILHKM